MGDTYVFDRELHGGGMSRVFVALDRSLGRVVAIKVLSPEVAAELKTERFRLEIQLAAKLQHPHIVPLLFAGENRGILYFTMPFIEGESLRAKIAREGPLPMSDALRTLRHVASALAYAHKQGVVHRDIKPDNVLLSGEFALVTDFGVAKALTASTTADGNQQLTGGGIAIGTPAYMAPEQALADPSIDHRADIYAFGVVAYEVLTGAPPFKAKTAQATLAAHVMEEPRPISEKRADVPVNIGALVMRCLAKKPDERPQSASDLVQVFDALPTSSQPTQPAFQPVVAPRRSHRTRWIGAGAGLAALALIGYFAATQNSGGSASAAADLSSIAVLPLENLGGDRNDEYFSDGMTDELASALSKLPGLRVASRTSSYAFKGKRPDVEEIGKKLRVQAFINGSVRRSGQRLRVTAQLTSVSDGLVLWSETYEREPRDVFQVQDDIARSIAGALKPRLGSQTQRISSDARGTNNLEAFDLYLRGRYLWNARGADNLRRAIGYFDSAIARDPVFARPHAARAVAYALLPEYTDTAPPNSSALAHAAARRALALDPNLAEAYTGIGLASVHEWKFREAEAAYRKAIQLDPRYATAHQWYGELLFHTGRIDSSLVEVRTAGELDPLAPIIPAALGYTLVAAREFDGAIAELKKGIELAPTLGLHHALLAAAYILAGRYSEAIPEAETAVRLEPELAIRKGYLAYAYSRVGRDNEARAIISRLRERRGAARPPAVALAVAYLGMKDWESALTSLEEAVSVRDIGLLTAASPVPDPIYDPIRSSPRFHEILKKMNLWEYAQRR